MRSSARSIPLQGSAPEMQAIAAALVDGENHTVDQLTKEALDAGTEALEVRWTTA